MEVKLARANGFLLSWDVAVEGKIDLPWELGAAAVFEVMLKIEGTFLVYSIAAIPLLSAGMFSLLLVIFPVLLNSSTVMNVFLEIGWVFCSFLEASSFLSNLPLF